MVARRSALVAVASTTFALSARADSSQPIALWLLGTWRSDRHRTMENLHFQGKSIPEPRKDAIAEIFGHLTYEISKSTFTLKDVANGSQDNQLSLKYTIEGHTDTSITLAFRGNASLRSLTLYRASLDSLFVKAGTNLEYFQRIAA